VSALVATATAGEAPFQISGVYPHLAMFNTQNECGTGAVVPWAGRLWVITYAPHKPNGSDDKLYEIDDDLRQTVRPESVGGTPASRMIHSESGQLFIGPYVIDGRGDVRVIPPSAMPGRLTGAARHLTDPAGKIYIATMEEGFYEVDVQGLKVTEIYPDANSSKDIGGDLLPGYHGKGLYCGQGRLVYANNGENSQEAKHNPHIESGCLAEWDGRQWTVIRRNQFTEVTGPGGLSGNPSSETDPIWSIGWDFRSLILMLRDGGKWESFRLPKASHCYDGAHGWNTEWPRIRDIGEGDLLMTMHGMFWRFPRTFRSGHTAGIAPRSSYLKVVGDFCRWGDCVVLGCDDTARAEFLNKRRAKGNLAAPGQSQSNLRFIAPERLDEFGPPIGRGAVWLNDHVRSGEPSDSFLFSGFDHRGVHLAHSNPAPVSFTFETDREGDGHWDVLKTLTVPAMGYRWLDFGREEVGAWVRVRVDRDCEHATAFFQYADKDQRTSIPDAMFDGLVRSDSVQVSGGLLRAQGEEKKTLQFSAASPGKDGARDIGYYEMGVDMKLCSVNDPKAMSWMKKNVAVPAGIVVADSASVLYTDESGKRFRLPKGDPSFYNTGLFGPERLDREVCTERDLFNCHGTFYELPAENAGGFVRIRPIATHNRHISDYCSYRGMLIMSGIENDTPKANGHIIRSEDGKCALWVGEVDDLWRLGKPVGRGGPLKTAKVKAGVPSDPYLMTGYDRKRVEFSHDGSETIRFTVEINATGDDWFRYGTFDVRPGETLPHDFPEGFNAYWVRIVCDADCTATAWFTYE